MAVGDAGPVEGRAIVGVDCIDAEAFAFASFFQKVGH